MMISSGRGHQEKYMPLKHYGELFSTLHQKYLRLREMLMGVSLTLVKQWGRSLSASFAASSSRAQTAAMERFMRHYGLSVRTVTKKSQVVPEDANALVAKFRSMLALMAGEQNFDHIVFGDETFVLFEPTRGKTLEARGAKSVAIRQFDEKSGVTAFLSASLHYCEKYGSYVCYLLPPDIIVKSKAKTPHNSCVVRSLNETESKNRPKNANGKRGPPSFRAWGSESGWSTEQLFHDMMALHLHDLKSEGKRGLVVVDLFASHRTEKFRQLALTRGYQVAYIPGGCTGLAQVHDVQRNHSTVVRNAVRQGRGGCQTYKGDAAPVDCDCL